MTNLKFSNGDIFPNFGLGTWLAKSDEVYHAVKTAVKAGYRHIDCAYIYKNEKEIGRALSELFAEGVVKREELFITSKLWNNAHAPEQAEPAIRKTLADLQLEYLDLYLIHWPFSFKKESPETAEDLISPDDLPLSITWSAMIELRNKGLTRHIGVSNFSKKKLQALADETGVKAEVNQVEIHPYFQQNELIEYCHKEDILVTAYSPLGSRHLIKTDDSISLNPTILQIAEKHRATPTQVILAWGMQRGVAVIPKSVNEERIIDNFGALNVKLDKEDMRSISQINRNVRNAKGLFGILPGGHYTYENLWDE